MSLSASLFIIIPLVIPLVKKERDFLRVLWGESNLYSAPLFLLSPLPLVRFSPPLLLLLHNKK